MKYRLLLFDKDRYIERFINSDTEREIEPFSFGKDRVPCIQKISESSKAEPHAKVQIKAPEKPEKQKKGSS